MAPIVPADKLCIGCEVVEGKYKCSTCRKYTCSVACNKKHRDEHPQEPKNEPDLAPSPDTLVGTEGSEGAERDVSCEPNELNLLFIKYPALKFQLRSIAEATDPPPSPRAESNNLSRNYDSSHRKQKPWTKDIGYQKGVEALRRALREDATGGVREFCELTRILNARRDAEEADAAFRRQIGQQDAELIGQLIREERD